MATEFCILRVNRLFDGAFIPKESHPYDCRLESQDFEMRQTETEVAWRLGGGSTCDESAAFVPEGVITATGTTIVRDDDFAHFQGLVTITGKEDQAGIIFFTGRMELIGRIGSHQFLGEACDASEHFEGWLHAAGEGTFDGQQLRCIVVGRGTLPEGAVNLPNCNRMSGTLFQPVQQGSPPTLG